MMLDMLAGHEMPFVLAEHVDAVTMSDFSIPRTVRLIEHGRREARLSLFKAQAALLDSFAEMARRERLRFVAIKGMALSREVYGDAFLRRSSDIDVLVDCGDICKADYVARRVGFVQAGEFFAARTMTESGRLDDDALVRMAAPFLVRHRAGYDHVSPHLAIADGHVISLEVHDGIVGLRGPAVDAFLWGTRRVRLGDVGVNVLALVPSLAALLLFDYDDSESAVANDTFATLGLKLYFDLACTVANNPWLLDQALGFLAKLGCSRQAAVVLGNLEEIFPEVDAGGCSTECSLWGSYLWRLFNPDGKRARAVRLERIDLVRSGFSLQGAGSSTVQWVVSAEAELSVEMLVRRREFVATWRLSAVFVADAESFVFQCRLFILDDRCPVAEIRFDAFCDEGLFRCFARPSSRYSHGGKASRRPDGMACKIEWGEADSTMELRLHARLENIAGIVGTEAFGFDAFVYQHHFGDVFHERFAEVKSVETGTRSDLRKEAK